MIVVTSSTDETEGYLRKIVDEPVNEKLIDPYKLSASTRIDPPTSFLERLRYIGPGLVSSASIVGSGELIATTALGASAGFVTLWVILVSCFVKIAIQLEFGRNAIYSGLPTMASFDHLPGKRIGKAHWTIWAYVLVMSSKFLQYGGIVGGIAIILNLIIPGVSISVWVCLVAIAVSTASFRGLYQWIEKLSVIMVVIFSGFTLTCVAMLFFTPYAISTSDLMEGLSFRLPFSSLGLAISAFGITGVSADEIVLYPYWCIEKGYASFVGPNNQSSQWVERAHGWIRVMYLDAAFSMLIYTSVTVAFYLLGAAVLHEMGQVPSGYGMIETLSEMYTKTIGSSGRLIFLFGAFATLASTLLVSVAGWSRVFTDAFSRMGLFKFENLASRHLMIALLSWGFPLIWALLFLYFEVPLLMVTVGGIGTTVLLLILVYCAIKFRYIETPLPLRPRLAYDLLLWISIVTMIGISLYGLIILIA